MPIRFTPLTLLILFPALLAVGGCADDSATPEADPSVRGLVVDSQGNPVSGAAILLSYDVSPNADILNKAMLVIDFSLAKESHVRIWISEPCRERMVDLLADSDMAAGRHSIKWNGRDEEGLRQVSGLYIVNLEADSTTTTTEIFLDIKTYAQYVTAEDMDRFAESGADGSFDFDQNCLVLGREMQGLGEDGTALTFTISRRVNLWAIHQDYGAASSAGLITIGEKNGASVVITFGELSQARNYAISHWNELRLDCAYDYNCAAGPPLAGAGHDYFAVSNYQNLPLWVSPADDEEDFLENIGRWMQFVFGWDDFLHPSAFMGEAYVPGDLAALDDPRVSAHRETYRAILGMMEDKTDWR